MAQKGQEAPRLSLKERDRRYSIIREHLKERGVDCVIVGGSNLFYLTNGLPGERYALLPTRAEFPLTTLIHRRHLADLSPQVLADSQDWVKDFRSGDDASPIIQRIKELHLENGTIGVTGSKVGYGGLSHGFYTQLQSELSGAKMVDVSDIFANVRTVKSEEEIAMIEKANRIFDTAIQRVQEIAQPGMLGSRVVQEGVKAMWDAGGDLESGFSFNFGPVPAQNPVLGHLCLTRRIESGDIGTLTAHAHYGQYGGHSDQEISFGDPKPLHREMFKAVQYVRDEVLKKVKAGVTHRDLEEAYRKACQETGFRSSPHSQIHQYGIDIPEFPGPGFFIRESQAEDSRRGGRANFALQPGMIYSISPTLMARESEDTLLGGTSLAVTENGYRELGDRNVELLVVS